MTALLLAQVTDTDCLRSRAPLVLGRMPGRYVSGPAAILRRVLYAWLLPTGVLIYSVDFGEGLILYEGMTLGPSQILGLRRRLEVAAEAEDFVAAASVDVQLVGGALQVAADVTLVDGRVYPLEVDLASSGAALRAQGV